MTPPSQYVNRRRSESLHHALALIDRRQKIRRKKVARQHGDDAIATLRGSDLFECRLEVGVEVQRVTIGDLNDGETSRGGFRRHHPHRLGRFRGKARHGGVLGRAASRAVAPLAPWRIILLDGCFTVMVAKMDPELAGCDFL